MEKSNRKISTARSILLDIYSILITAKYQGLDYDYIIITAMGAIEQFAEDHKN
jgi:hypothetical protein